MHVARISRQCLARFVLLRAQRLGTLPAPRTGAELLRNLRGEIAERRIHRNQLDEYETRAPSASRDAHFCANAPVSILQATRSKPHPAHPPLTGCIYIVFTGVVG